ncbi:MAG: hypothetical protein K0T99_00570 [Alphaproteobacteria bacterium]|nr:hypothetical protein [Alphaproteobacteria bacterium]
MINISKKQTRIENFLFINYVYFFAVILSLVSNSANSNATPITSFISLFSKPETSVSDFFNITGGVFITPLLLFLFGLTVNSHIKSSSVKEFLKDRFCILGKLFLISAFIIMPLSYYFSNPSIMQKYNFWEYITEDYFKTWKIGPAWIFSSVLLFDLIIAGFMKFFSRFIQTIIALVKESSITKLICSCFALTFLAFFFSNTSGEVQFSLIADNSNEWWHIGPFWIQKNIVLTYFVIYFFSVLFGSSEKFINYIFAANGELSSKWLHRLLEVIILYLLIKFITPKAPFFGSELITTAIFASLYILMIFMSAASFFSLLDRFAYRKSKLLNFFSKHSIIIFAVHFLPLALIKSYTADFNMSDLQRLYVVVLFTFFVSLLISIMIQFVWPLNKE